MNLIIDDDLMAFMGKQESQYLIKPTDLIADIRENIYRKDELIRGQTLPWSKTTKNIRLRPGEVSLWAGINGHGKSNLLGQVTAWGLNTKWLVASMEMPPAITVERMIKQVAGTGTPSIEYIEKVVKWMDNNLWLYDQTDSVDSDRILALVRYASAIGIKHVVIDSLIKCGIAKRDMEGQARFVDRLCWLAKSHKIHVHLVHHIRKTDSELNMPGKFDVRGAGEIVDLVDNIFIVYRNKLKEEKYPNDNSKPDCILTCAKQRHFSWEGNYSLYFNKDCGQYVPDHNRVMTHWLNA